jgi:hypothetical protein
VSIVRITVTSYKPQSPCAAAKRSLLPGFPALAPVFELRTPQPRQAFEFLSHFQHSILGGLGLHDPRHGPVGRCEVIERFGRTQGVKVGSLRHSPWLVRRCDTRWKCADEVPISAPPAAGVRCPLSAPRAFTQTVVMLVSESGPARGNYGDSAPAGNAILRSFITFDFTCR